MSRFTTIKGLASHVRHASTTTGSTYKGSGSVSTSHTTTLRVNGKPGHVALRGTMDINDGDMVSLAGNDKNGIFVGYAICNETTGIVYSDPTALRTLAGFLIIIAGIPFIWLFGLGLILIGIGIYLVSLASRPRKCAELLRGQGSL